MGAPYIYDISHLRVKYSCVLTNSYIVILVLNKTQRGWLTSKLRILDITVWNLRTIFTYYDWDMVQVF